MTGPPCWRAPPHPICTPAEATPRPPATDRTHTPSPMPNSRAPSSDPTRRAVLLAERRLRRTIRSDLHAFAGHVLAPLGQVPAAHHRRMLDELAAVSRGETDRLMLLLPPGAAKSTYASLIFPAWWFIQHPESQVIAASHTAALAQHFGRRLRNLIGEQQARLGYALRRDARAAASFSLANGASYYAVGVRGPLTGRRADLILIDDPVKSQAEADSASARRHLWDWYRSELLTRLRPGGRIVLIMTRWHEDDLGGRLLAQEVAQQALGDAAATGERWRCLRLPALAEEADPLGRAPGEALWPEWENAEALARKRAAIGERGWAALFQQTPHPPEGLLFATTAIETIAAAPAEARRVRAWDLAATARTHGGDPDYTAGVRLARTPQGRFVVEDVVRLQGGPGAVEAAIRATASRDGEGIPIALPQDPGQAGRAQVLYLTRQLAGYVIHASPETGAKATRAAPVAAQVEAGNLAVLRAPWNPAFLDELRDFPAGSKDDQVDALSRAFSYLLGTARPAAQLPFSLLSR